MNPNIAGATLKAYTYLSDDKEIVISVSGGSDSDIMLDLVHKSYGLNKDNVHIIWFDTSIEYQATKEHLEYLERKYQINIERLKAKMSIPSCVKKHGVPLFSKFISEMLERGQKNGFDYLDYEYEELLSKYNNLNSFAGWWCNKYNEEREFSRFTIQNRKGLKEYLIDNPPDFKISSKCCQYAKKDIGSDYSKKIEKETNKKVIELIGIRKAEGGVRAKNNKCFIGGERERFYPIFWLTEEDKKEYEKLNQIKHSRCYTEYGLKRTGCVGCPYGVYSEELKIIERHEPKLLRVCENVFGRAYEYQNDFKRYRIEKKRTDNNICSLCEFGVIL